MPKYAVVVCPDCRVPFITEPGPKTVSCRHCNKRHEAAKLRVFLSTDDFRQAQAMRGSINAHICGDPTFDEGNTYALDIDIATSIEDKRFADDKRQVEEMMREEARQSRKKGQQALLIEAFDDLSENGDVSIEEYWTKVSLQGISRKKFDEWVEKMVEGGVAYFPRHGYLRKG